MNLNIEMVSASCTNEQQEEENGSGTGRVGGKVDEK